MVGTKFRKGGNVGVNHKAQKEKFFSRLSLFADRLRDTGGRVFIEKRPKKKRFEELPVEEQIAEASKKFKIADDRTIAKQLFKTGALSILVGGTMFVLGEENAHLISSTLHSILQWGGTLIFTIGVNLAGMATGLFMATASSKKKE